MPRHYPVSRSKAVNDKMRRVLIRELLVVSSFRNPIIWKMRMDLA